VDVMNLGEIVRLSSNMIPVPALLHSVRVSEPCEIEQLRGKIESMRLNGSYKCALFDL